MERCKAYVVFRDSLDATPVAPRRMERKMNWISVDKELPAPNVHVLVCTNWGKVVISSLQEHGRWSGFRAYTKEVLYWYPLPPVPKAVKEKLKREIGYTVRERNPIRKEEQKDEQVRD